MKFKNKNAEALINAMKEASEDFEQRRKNQIFRSILFGLAETYPEDRHKIFSIFGKQDTKDIPQGGARIIRKQDESKRKVTGSGCEGCGQGQVVERAVAPDPTVKVGQRKTKKIDLSEFESIEDILDRFESRPAAIIAFAQTIGVSIPASVTRAKTAAKYVLEEANKQRKQNEEEE